MNIKKSLLLTVAITTFIFCFASCDKKTVKIVINEEKTESMILISAGIVTTVPVDEHASGPFAKASPTTPVKIAAFKIGACEVTYALWYKVYTWATTKNSNAYIFANQGMEGNRGIEGAEPTSDNKYEPVTKVSWRDCIVWCNAYSEYTNKTPVYFSDNSYTTIWQNSNSSVEKNLYVKSDADGYRLPTDAEWEYADRGGNPQDSTHWDYTYLKSNTIDDEAWNIKNSDNRTHSVAGKNANAAGLYDMKGNVPEWCFDAYNPTTKFRVKRGGAYYFCEEFCAVPYHAGNGPDYATNSDGFRICCSVF